MTPALPTTTMPEKPRKQRRVRSDGGERMRRDRMHPTTQHGAPKSLVQQAAKQNTSRHPQRDVLRRYSWSYSCGCGCGCSRRTPAAPQAMFPAIQWVCIIGSSPSSSSIVRLHKASGTAVVVVSITFFGVVVVVVVVVFVPVRITPCVSFQ